jgi:enoyl-[acyl-carrier protein] reductase III
MDCDMSESNSPFTALVSGGSKGIGLAIALRLANPGATLFINYASDENAAREAAERVSQRGASAHLIKSDIGSPQGSAEVMAMVASKVTRLDALVHASAVPNPGLLETQSLESIRCAVEVGGMALLYLVRAATGLLGNGSSVLFLSGNGVDLVLPNHGALAAAKALGECLVRYLAIEYASRGINFNTLRVGPVDTALYRQAIGAAADTTGPLTPPTPNGRRLTAADAALAAEFLISKKGAMIRGQTLLVDGGLSTTVRVR